MRSLHKDAILSLVWPVSDPVPTVERPPKPERAAAVTTEYATLRSALAAIPDGADSLEHYDIWRNAIFAIHHATGGSAEGLALAHEFSARSAKYDPEFLESNVWSYAGRTDGEVITERTLFAMAATHGWQDPSVADDFEEVQSNDVHDDFQALATHGAQASDPGTASAVPPGAGEAITSNAPGAAGAAAVPGGSAERFRPIPAAEFAVASPLRWIIKGVLPQADLAVLYGESGSGKTFMALDMVAAIALGQPWRGLKVHQGAVVYIAAEGAGGFRNRLRAYAHQHELDLRDLPLHVIPAAPNMLDKTDALDVAKAIVQRVERPSIIVVDTLAQTMPGGNENAGEDMGKVLAHCKGLRRATGAMVLLVHHSGKDASKGARGWSGLRAAADVEMEVLRADDNRVLSLTKQKDGDDGGEFGFKLETVLVDMDADGDEVTSCVVVHGDGSRAALRKNGPKGRNEQVVHQAVLDLLEPGGDLPDREAVLQHALASTPPPEEGKRDTRRQHFDRALRGLLDRGLLVADGLRIGVPE